MSYEFKCPECGRTKVLDRGMGCGYPEGQPLPPPPPPPANPDCDFCQTRMHRVYSFSLHWPKDKRGH